MRTTLVLIFSLARRVRNLINIAGIVHAATPGASKVDHHSIISSAKRSCTARGASVTDLRHEDRQAGQMRRRLQC